MAERVRFELTVLAYTRVPGVHLKPLGHLSTHPDYFRRWLILFSIKIFKQKTSSNFLVKHFPKLISTCPETSINFKFSTIIQENYAQIPSVTQIESYFIRRANEFRKIQLIPLFIIQCTVNIIRS